MLIMSCICCSPHETSQTGTVLENNEVIVDEIPASIQRQEDIPDKNNEKPELTTRTGTLKVHFIDVGQGDAIFIRTPTKNILIDGGERGDLVVNYLKANAITHLDLVIGTHPHSDHIGGLVTVLQSITVKEVIDPGIIHTSKTFEDYLTLIDEKNIRFTEGRAGNYRDLGDGAILEILHPAIPSSSHLNDASIVTKITFGQVSFMLTGDAEEASEQAILFQSRLSSKSTILKVGHHGSHSSTTQPFLDAVNPEVAVIMCGKDNTYGHPHEETLTKLSQASIDIYRTDIHGTIVITTDGQVYDINVKQPYQYVPQKIPEDSPQAEQPVKKSFVGSIKSDRYHKPGCRHVKNILPDNKIWFDSVREAKSKGYAPCGACKPPG